MCMFRLLFLFGMITWSNTNSLSAEFSSIYCLKTKVCSFVLPFPNYRFPGNCKVSFLLVVKPKCDQFKKQVNVPIYSCHFSRVLKNKKKLKRQFYFSNCATLDICIFFPSVPLLLCSSN